MSLYGFYLKPTKKPCGQPATTWISMINSDLKEFRLKLEKEEHVEKTHDRLVWETLILSGTMPKNSKMCK